jgi:TldD protein
VVLGPGGGGLLLHEACGHALEADGLGRGSSVFAGVLGQVVASPLVTAVDDPSLAGRYGSYGHDDEGARSSPTTLIDAGVLVGAMSSRDTSAAVPIASANARRQSYAHPPEPRMSNTFVRNGPTAATSILAAVDHGVYVPRLRGGDVDIVTGAFAFVAAEAYLVRRGEVVHPLAEVTLSGNSMSAMRWIVDVGDDLDLTEALCAKNGQQVPVCYGSPTMRVEGLVVSGGGRG